MSNASMTSLLKRVQHVYEECGGKDDKAKDEMVAPKGADQFEVKKVEIVNLLKKTRQELKEKEETEKAEGNSAAVIKLKNSINKAIKKLEEDHKNLKLAVNPKKRINIGKKMDEATIAKRNEEVELIGKHIAEVKDIMRSAFKKGNTDDEDVGASAARNNRRQLDLDKMPTIDPTKSSLPEIDISEGLKELERKDKLIDDALDQVSAGLDRLAVHANNFSDTLDMQNQMIDKANEKAEKATDRLRALNVKLEDTIKKVGAQKMIVVTILIIIIVIVVGAVFIIAQSTFFP